MILPLYSVMKGIDLRLMRAAQSLGRTTFPRVLHRLSAAVAARRLCRRDHRLHPVARLLHHAGFARRAALDHAVDAGADAGAEPAAMGQGRRHGRGAAGHNLRAFGARRAGDAVAGTGKRGGADGDEAAHPRSSRPRLPAGGHMAGGADAGRRADVVQREQVAGVSAAGLLLAVVPEFRHQPGLVEQPSSIR